MEANLTRSKIDGLKLPKGKTEGYVQHSKLPGFVVRLRAGKGAVSKRAEVWYRDGRGERRKVRLGPITEQNFDDRILEAKKVQGEVANGGDPARERVEEKAKPGYAFSKMVDEFLESQRRLGKARSTIYANKLYLRGSEDHAGFGVFADREAEDITRRDIVRILNEMAEERGGVCADRAASSISAAFTNAVSHGLLEANPATNLPKYSANKPRERVLTTDEITKLWLEVGDDDYGRIVKLLILTGCRKSEIGGLHRDEIDLEKRLIRIPGARTKNSVPHTIPLTDQMLEVLDDKIDGDGALFGRGETGFSGWSKSKARLDARLEIKPWTLHDIRRSVVTGMNELGVLWHIVEACINHVSGAKGGVAGVYNRAEYLEPKREAFEKWNNHVAVLLAQASGANISTLRPPSGLEKGRRSAK